MAQNHAQTNIEISRLNQPGGRLSENTICHNFVQYYNNFNSVYLACVKLCQQEILTNCFQPYFCYFILSFYSPEEEKNTL